MTETVQSRTRGEPEQPEGPRLPEILGPWEALVWLWKRLRRMSTALLLLFTLAAASVVATFIPQEPVIAQTVAEWRSGASGPGEQVAAVFAALGLFDVFGSWWFTTLTVLLFISLTGCLVPRYRAFARALRRPPVPGRNLDRLTSQATMRTQLPPDAALEAVEEVLRRKRFRRLRVGAERTVAGVPQVAGERGHWREGGSLVFHTAFYVLMVGVVIGQAFGFTGQVNVAEGGVFSDTRIGYGAAEPGRWFGLEDHRGFTVRLDDFDVSYFDDRTPREFVSTVTILEGDRSVRRGQRIRVNHPLAYAGMKLYQVRFGMAPRVIVRSGDTVLFDDQVMLGEAGGDTWAGAAKIKLSDPQLALDMVLLPDAGVVEGDDGDPQIVNGGPEPANPRLFADLWVGDLGLERALPASQFVRQGNDRLGGPIVLAEGDSASAVDGRLTVEFAELTMWSGFQVSHAPGRWILLLAAVLILVGLIPSLYSYRRRVWAEAHPSEDGTRVLLAGTALHRKPVFAEEFAQIVEVTRRRLDATDTAAKESP